MRPSNGFRIQVNAVVWRILLGVCSNYGEVEMGERAIKKILDLERECGGDFAVLSNMVGSVMLNKHGSYWMRGKLLRFLGLLWLVRFSSHQNCSV